MRGMKNVAWLRMLLPLAAGTGLPFSASARAAGKSSGDANADANASLTETSRRRPKPPAPRVRSPFREGKLDYGGRDQLRIQQGRSAGPTYGHDEDA